ncbi:uncharacterized protein O3C94_019296 isoform 2-T2 [Discoglossus pictus]
MTFCQYADPYPNVPKHHDQSVASQASKQELGTLYPVEILSQRKLFSFNISDNHLQVDPSKDGSDPKRFKYTHKGKDLHFQQMNHKIQSLSQQPLYINPGETQNQMSYTDTGTCRKSGVHSLAYPWNTHTLNTMTSVLNEDTAGVSLPCPPDISIPRTLDLDPTGKGSQITNGCYNLSTFSPWKHYENVSSYTICPQPTLSHCRSSQDTQGQSNKSLGNMNLQIIQRVHEIDLPAQILEGDVNKQIQNPLGHARFVNQMKNTSAQKPRNISQGAVGEMDNDSSTMTFEDSIDMFDFSLFGDEVDSNEGQVSSLNGSKDILENNSSQEMYFPLESKQPSNQDIFNLNSLDLNFQILVDLDEIYSVKYKL